MNEDEDGDDETNTRELVKTQNRKQKKSGGFQSMGTVSILSSYSLRSLMVANPPYI